MADKKKPGPNVNPLKLGGNWEDAIKRGLTTPPLTPDPPRKAPRNLKFSRSRPKRTGQK